MPYFIIFSVISEITLILRRLRSRRGYVYCFPSIFTCLAAELASKRVELNYNYNVEKINRSLDRSVGIATGY
jgi:hypothetical protein